MLASKQFGCKAFFQSLILVVLCPLSYFVTTRVLLRYPWIQLPGRGPSMQRFTCTISGSQCMIGPSFCNTARHMSRNLHQDIFRNFFYLPPFTVGGEFIRVIQLLLVFSLGGGFPLGFPSFPHLVCFGHCLSFSIVQGDLWPLFLGPQHSYALYVFYSS